MKRKTIVNLAIPVCALMMLFSLIMFGAGMTAHAAESKFRQEVYDNVGMITSESTFPGFLQSDAAAQTKATEKMKAAYRSMTEGGFDMGDIWTGEKAGGIREWQGFAVQEFRNGDHTADLWGRVHGYVVCGTVADNIDAGCIVNDMLVNWSSHTGEWGYPIGNQFTLNGSANYLYQNFINGYARLQTSNKVATFMSKKFLNADGTETASPIAGVPVGEIRENEMPYWAVGKEEQIKAAFEAAVDKIKNTDAVKKGGYDIGLATDFVTLWKTENMALTQPFGGGENDGNPYGWGAQGRIMLSDGDAVAFPLLGAALTRWAALNGFRMIGYPLSYPFTLDDGLSYQLFSKAYFVTDELGYIENVQLYAGALSYADRMTLGTDTGMAIAMSDFMEIFKNRCNTGEPFGVPDDYMSYDPAAGTFMQSFTAPGGKNYIVMRKARGTAVTITGEAAKLFGEKGIAAMGAPIAEAFVLSGTTYQNFEKGYAKNDEFVAGKNVLTDGTESELGHIAIHPDTGVFEDGTDWPASAKDEFVSKVRELNETGIYCYEPAGKVKVVKGYAVQEFVNTTSSSKGRLALVKSGKNAPVYALVDVFYDLYESRGGYENDMDVPTGDRFCFGGKVFQNFRHGYATVDSANMLTFSTGTSISEDGVYTDSVTGEEVDPVPVDVGQFGDINRIPIDMRSKADEIKAAFRAEYMRLMRAGFYPGETDEELVHQWAPQPSYNWLNQTFKNGDSTAAAFGNNSAMKIFLMDLEKGAFSIYSEMLTAWINNGSINGPGYPTGNQFVYDGDLYQNFANGYIRCPNCISTSAEFYSEQTFTPPASDGKDGGGSGNGGSNKAKIGMWVGIGVGIAVVVAAAITLPIVLTKKRKGGTK